MTVVGAAGARGEPSGRLPSTSMVSPGSCARASAAASRTNEAMWRQWARNGGTWLPSFSRRGESALRRQAGLLAPGSAAPFALRAVPPSPPLSGRVDLRDWLPGYSGGTAPAFDRLPSRPPSGGATAADFSCRRGCTACRPLRSRPQRPQRGVAGHREVGPELVDEVAHAFHARELFQARERLLLAAFDDQLRPLLADAGQEAQLSLGGAVDVEHAGHGRLAGFLPGRFRVWRG